MPLDDSLNPRLTRRAFIQAGTAGIAGLGALTAAATPNTRARARSVILLWMDGGPAQMDTFDPKSMAPEGIRSEFAQIRTSVPGIHISSLLPKTARIMHRAALIRTVCHAEGAHERACHLALTGRRLDARTIHPSLGSLAADGLLSPQPACVAIAPPGFAYGFGGAGLLAHRTQPWHVIGNPASAEFSSRDVAIGDGRAVDDSDATIQRAFELGVERPATRTAYGHTRFGQSCLLARRLVEAGVRFVTVNLGGWDTHSDNARSLSRWLGPTLDSGLSALISDLAERGLLNQTLVVWMGEFGRTPWINSLCGRDHWPRAGCALLAGAGVPGGAVIGATDSVAGEPTDRPVHPGEIAATICAKLGLPGRGEFPPIAEAA